MTAVEWLVNKFGHAFQLAWEEEIQQALEMEKQQIIDACNYGDFEELGEKYYNETYKKP
jgi:hypothetical protein